jgi:hypothetical protein
VFVVRSLLWGWWIGGHRPDVPSVVGGAICLVGVAVITCAGPASRERGTRALTRYGSCASWRRLAVVLETADIALMPADLEKLAFAMRLSHGTLGIVKHHSALPLASRQGSSFSPSAAGRGSGWQPPPTWAGRRSP